jgi:hypothetical protein
VTPTARWECRKAIYRVIARPGGRGDIGYSMSLRDHRLSPEVRHPPAQPRGAARGRATPPAATAALQSPSHRGPHGHLEQQLLPISPRQIDRRLAPQKRQLSKRLYGRTKPGTLLTHHIPLKTDRWAVTTSLSLIP